MNVCKKINILVIIYSSLLSGMEGTIHLQSSEKFSLKLKKLTTLCSRVIQKNPHLLTEKNIKKLPIELVQKQIKHHIIGNKRFIAENPLTTFNGHTDYIGSLCAIRTKNGARITSGSADKTVRVWDLEGVEKARCIGHEGLITSLCAIRTKEGVRIISGSADKTIRIWNFKGTQEARCEGHKGSVLTLHLLQTKNGVRIISGSTDKTVRVWNLQGEQLERCEGHTNSVYAVSLVNTNNEWKIVSGSADNTIKVWHALPIFKRLNTIGYEEAVNYYRFT